MKKINWFKVGEIGGWILAAVGTLIGGLCGTRNAATEVIKEEIEKINGKEDKKES